MAGPASTVAFVIARSPARASKAPAAPDGPPGADASWGRRHPGATATLQAPCLAGDLDAGVLRAAGIPRRSHPPAARPPPGSHGNRSRIGRSSATCAAAVVQELRRGDDEHDRQSNIVQPRRGQMAGPTRMVQLSPRCRASRCEIAQRLRGHVEQQRHAVDRGVGAGDQHKLPRIQLTAGDHGPLEHPEQHWPWQPVSQPPADHVPTAASNAAQSTTTSSRRWPARHSRAASAAVPPPHWPGYAVKHDLLGGKGTQIRSDRANDT